MKVYINDLEVDKALISQNTGLNFGRFDFDGLLIDNYRIIIPYKDFIDIIEADYNVIRDEIKLDDEAQNETSSFTIINYGSITKLLENKQAMQDIITTYLSTILFSKLFAKSNNASFIINSTDMVEINNNKIEISGRSYRKQ